MPKQTMPTLDAAAVEAAVEGGDSGQIDHWEADAVRRLDGDEPERAIADLAVLGRRRDVILEAARHGSNRVRSAAMDALAGFEPDDHTVNTLDLALADENPYVAGAALRTVAALSLKTFHREVLDLCHDPVWQVAFDAFRALGAVGDSRPEDIDAVGTGLRHGTRKVRHAALSAAKALQLRGLAPEVLGLLRDAIADEQPVQEIKRFVAALGSLEADPDDAGPVLHGLLQRPGMRSIAAKALRRVPYPPARDDLASLLDDPSDRLRAVAASALLAIDQTTSTVAKLLDHPDANVRGAVLRAVSDAPDPDLANRLRDLAIHDPAPNRAPALRAHARATGTFDLAAQSLHDPNPDVVEAAREILEEHGLDPDTLDTPPERPWVVRRWRLVDETTVYAPTLAAARQEVEGEGLWVTAAPPGAAHLPEPSP